MSAVAHHPGRRPCRPRPRATATRTAGGAGCSRPTTRTSARCTCCSASRCSWSAACWRCCIRAELFQPGLQFVNPELFNQLTTMHGLIMVFGAIMPAFVGFANWMIPLQIGAPDMAFARMNNLSFWLLIPAALMLVGSFFMPGGAPAAGWTLYAPLTLQMGPSMDAGIFALHILGASSIMGSINIIVTILNMRAPGMTLMKMPTVLLDLADHRLPADRGDAGAGRRDHDDADRPPLRHQLLQPGRRRRPGDVPAHLLVLRPPRGLHHDPAGVRDHQRRSSRRSRASGCSATPRWSTRRRRSRSCRSSSGRTTCSRPACR